MPESDIPHLRSVLTILGGKVVSGEGDYAPLAACAAQAHARLVARSRPLAVITARPKPARNWRAPVAARAAAQSMAMTMPPRSAPMCPPPMVQSSGARSAAAAGRLIHPDRKRIAMKKTMFLTAVVLFGTAPATAQKTPDFAVVPQYDTTHVYVPQDQYDAFMRSFVATFGGSLSKQGQFQVTPTPSRPSRNWR